MAERSRQARRLRAPGAVSATARAAAGARMPAQRLSQAVGKTSGGRKQQAQARRQAILEAALAVFAARGYEAARLDDVAAQAGVAKGTLYLYFKDKQALFEELVRGAVTPIIDRASAAALVPNMRARQILELFFALFRKEVLDTNRKLLLRLIIAEGPRFPAVAAYYHREVVARGMALMRAIASEAVARGESPTMPRRAFRSSLWRHCRSPSSGMDCFPRSSRSMSTACSPRIAISSPSAPGSTRHDRTTQALVRRDGSRRDRPRPGRLPVLAPRATGLGISRLGGGGVGLRQRRGGRSGRNLVGPRRR